MTGPFKLDIETISHSARAMCAGATRYSFRMRAITGIDIALPDITHATMIVNILALSC